MLSHFLANSVYSVILLKHLYRISAYLINITNRHLVFP